jgi:hypothetical protein
MVTFTLSQLWRCGRATDTQWITKHILPRSSRTWWRRETSPSLSPISVLQPVTLLTKTFQLITKALTVIIWRILPHLFFGKSSYIVMMEWVLSRVLARNAFYLMWLYLFYVHVKSRFMFLVLYYTVFRRMIMSNLTLGNINRYSTSKKTVSVCKNIRLSWMTFILLWVWAPLGMRDLTRLNSYCMKNHNWAEFCLYRTTLNNVPVMETWVNTTSSHQCI